MFPPKAPDWPVEVAYDDLPAWMRSARRLVDWPLVGAVILVAALVAPLITQPLPWSAGLRAEVARTLEMSESIQAGILYPRWAADFNLGYGSPLWNYLPPLPHYLAGLHRVLAQTSAEFSVKVTLISALVLLGLALFGFARRRWGTYAGLLAAALGLFSPQVALAKPLLDGDLGALFAGGFWLASLWALDRLLTYGRGASLLLAAGACAGVWLSHEPLNAIFSVFTLAWLLFRLGAGHPGDAIRAGLLAYVLGFAACAFYWLPAWTERTAIRWQPAAGADVMAGGNLSAHELFGWPPTPDLAAINGQAVPALGVALWGAAAIALLLIVTIQLRMRRNNKMDRDRLRHHRLADSEALFFGAIGALLIVAALLPLGDTWSGAIRWPPFGAQDLVFPAALCLALLGASLGYRLAFFSPRRRAMLAMIVLAALIGLAGAPAIATPRAPSAARDLTPARLMESEVRGVPLSGHEPGWLLPRNVATLPSVEASLAPSYESGLVDKVVRENLPATTLADTIEHTAHSERIMVRSAGAAEITLRTFLFDGWRAELDGEPLALQATEPEGLITFQIPEGQHELLIKFGSTSARTAGWLISGVACLLLLGLAVRQEYHPLRAIMEDGERFPPRANASRSTQATLLGAVAILVVASVAARLVPGWGASKSPPGTVAQTSTPLLSRFQSGIDLLAYNLAPPTERGASFALTLYWRGWRPDLPDYQVDLQLVSINEGTGIYPLTQRRHPGQLPTSEWPRWPLLEHYVIDTYTLAVPSDAPSDKYRIAIQIGRCSHLNPAPCSEIAPVFAQADGRASLEQSVVLPDVIAIED